MATVFTNQARQEYWEVHWDEPQDKKYVVLHRVYRDGEQVKYITQSAEYPLLDADVVDLMDTLRIAADLEANPT